ncbi:MAG TPA: hypothetical protein VKZ89_16950 [Thermobifida alba]|uniref:hypothetical protein n=1 Tax=Thermobifida cellulosilytica TaxID=144786 RepID=UPI0018DE655D|nr:hypothetical protein [Thermobifida cellulosilytica]HLU98522.1 hypothetical protein [Thermobifida alba]
MNVLITRRVIGVFSEVRNGLHRHVPLWETVNRCPSTIPLGEAMFKRRIGPPPHEGGESAAVNSCPDIWELDSGDFAVIGFERTAQLLPHLPPDAFVDPGEAIVVLPRSVLVKARENIPLE